ncbi:MAG: YdcF family protein [Verrucomicrobia bacterium]|nr:YdcF family protein [Verrucomicrobiota bacterium]
MPAGLIATGVIFAGTAVWAQYLVGSAGQGRLFDDLEAVPAREVGLVLGTSRLARSGRLNQYFRARIEAAAALYRAGKVRKLILSGNGVESGYNEPEDMQRALLNRGLPAEALLLDPAGVRTIDSILRARRVFSVGSFTIISQKFHNERALFLSRAYGIDAIAFDADAVRKVSGYRAELREMIARLVAVWEACVVRRDGQGR